MNITVTIRDNEFSCAAGYGVEIGSAFERAFEPLATSDDKFIGALVGDPSEAVARRIVKLRKDAAKEISEEITRVLISHMQKNDTHNGYAK